MSVTQTLKLAGIRGIIAQKMRESMENTAQLSFFCDVNASAMIAARAQWKAAEYKIGFEDLVLKALAAMLPDFPTFNAIETPTGVECLDEIHVGCAIALPGALVAPAVFNVEQRSLPEIAAARTDLVDRARRNKLTITELTGATITVTNLGLTRVEHFTPIVTYPQQAIIGLGRITPKACVADDGITIVARPVMGLSLTVDHRINDGAPAGEFLSRLAEELETGRALNP